MRIPITLIAAAGIVMITWTAMGQGNTKNLRARLSGYQEVPALSTEASGEFRGRIDPRDTELSYDLSYSGLRGTVTQAHIHFGNAGTNGGVMIWLCGTATNPGPAGTPTCPQEGSVGRTITASNVVGPAGQGIPPGDFQQALAAIRSGAAYVNVHSTQWPGGEVRGQINEER
jgi:hypothetical protein